MRFEWCNYYRNSPVRYVNSHTCQLSGSVLLSVLKTEYGSVRNVYQELDIQRNIHFA